MTQNGQPDATEGQTGILPEGSQGAPGPDSEGAAAPEGVKMVPATDLARVHGEKGSLQQALKTSEARTAELETQLSARENGGPPTDDERLRFEQEARELREERRETQRLLKEAREERRGTFLSGLAAKYPLVPQEELDGYVAGSPDVSEDAIARYAADTHLERMTAAAAEAAAKPNGNGAPPNTRLDTPGGGSGSTTPPQMNSREKREAGLAARRQNNSDQYRSVGA